MTPLALHHLIANGDDTRHQFKREFAHVSGTAAELPAFPNGLGGTLVTPGQRRKGWVKGRVIGSPCAYRTAKR